MSVVETIQPRRACLFRRRADAARLPAGRPLSRPEHAPRDARGGRKSRRAEGARPRPSSSAPTKSATCRSPRCRPATSCCCGRASARAVDGAVIEGRSEIDQSLITGETLPRRRRGRAPPSMPARSICPARLRVRVSAASEGTLLAEISRLLDNAVQARSRYVQLADRASRLYAPVVHAAALLTMLGWVALGATWHDAIVTAIAVLIITCPCALGLAIPAVQTVVVGRDVPRRRAAQFRRCHRAAGRRRPRRVRQDGNADLAGTRRRQCRRHSERRVRTRRAAGAGQPSSGRRRGGAGRRGKGAAGRGRGDRRPGRARLRRRASKCGWAGRRSAARTQIANEILCRDPEASVVAFRHGETRHVFAVRQRLRPDAAGAIAALHQGAASQSRFCRAIASLRCAMRPRRSAFMNGAPASRRPTRSPASRN